MKDYVLVLSFVISAVLAILFFASAIAGVIRGRVKIEPHQPWVAFRERPAGFAALVAWYLGFASLFALASARLASGFFR